MPGHERGPRSLGALAALLVAAIFAFGGLMALGIWQVKRLAWKEDLIARVQRLVHAPPVAAPGPGAWPTLERSADEYRHVIVRGHFANERETFIAATTEMGAGYWVLTPLHTDQGFWVLVNRGFIPGELRDPAKRTAPVGEQQVAALLRLSEPGGGPLRSNDPAAGRWYSRDVAAIAAARGLGSEAVAPYFVDATAAGATAHSWPRPGMTVLQFSNNHRVYAATWFALALMLACGIGFFVFDEKRMRRMQRHAGDAPLAAPDAPDRR
jgi:surfeit locus 1 family protein